MELRRLRLLDHLARLGTVAAVADALSYSASSVSVELAQLEGEAASNCSDGLAATSNSPPPVAVWPPTRPVPLPPTSRFVPNTPP
jgi:hypothetical protein